MESGGDDEEAGIVLWGISAGLVRGVSNAKGAVAEGGGACLLEVCLVS